MDFLINATDISVVGQVCFTCNCYYHSCYQVNYMPTCVSNACGLHCWTQSCSPRMDPYSLT